MTDTERTEEQVGNVGHSRQTHVALLSSFILFLISGFFILYTNGGPGGWISAKATYPSAQVFVWFGLFANGIYFFFFASLLEQHTSLQVAVQTLSAWRRWAEYVVRIINHVLILMLWTTFQDGRPYIFALYLILLYLSFIAWDLFAYKALRQVDMCGLVGFDMAGLLLSLAIVGLLILGAPSAIGDDDALYWMVLGITCVGYAAVAGGGIRYGFKKGYRPWQRDR